MSLDSITTHEIQLALQSFKMAITVDHDRSMVMNNHNTFVTDYLAPYARHQIIQFNHQVYCGKPSKETHVVSYPKGWWNAFKEAYPKLCRFFTKPVYTSVTVSWEGRLAFPDLAPLTSEYRSFAIWGSPDISLSEDLT